MTTFRELPIGAEFDFIGKDLSKVSFWARCRKTSARTYRDDKRNRYQVGTINVEVYNVGIA